MESLRTATRQAGWAVREALWPRRCPGCGMRGTWACTECLERAPLWTPPWCARCGVPEVIGCLCSDLPDAVDVARSAGRYGDWLEAAIRRLKYGGEFARAAHLGELLAPLFAELPAPDLVVPVPLHPKRLRERGYNQSTLLAEAALPGQRERIDESAVSRVVDTPPQARLSGEARQLNVQAAFRVDTARLPANARVVIVDDVMTTGATIGELARVFRQAGAQSVAVATVARAIPRHPHQVSGNAD